MPGLLGIDAPRLFVARRLPELVLRSRLDELQQAQRNASAELMIPCKSSR